MDKLGLADACARAGRPPPEVARAPSMTVGPEAEPERPLPPDPVDLQRALDYAEFYVPASDHAPLGLTPQALEADPPAPWRDVQLVRPLVELRSSAVASCLPVYRYSSGWEYSVAVMSFVLDRDGRTSRLILEYEERSEAVDRCVRDAVAGWEFPRPVTGGRMWFKVKGTGPVKDAPPPRGHVVRPTAGWRRPSEKDPGCIARNVTLPPAFAGVSGRTTVRYTVNPDGRASDFLLLQPAPTPIARSIRQAVYACQFVPAADEEGTLVTMWVIMPVRFVAP